MEKEILSKLTKVITPENINNYDENGYTILWKMVKKGYNSVIKFLIEQGADLELKPKNDEDEDTILDSSYENESDIEDEFDFEEDLKIDIGTPLFKSICIDKFETSKLLIENGANLNYCYGQCSCLTLAIKKNNYDFVNFLIQKNVKINILGKFNFQIHTPLYYAISNNNLDIVKLLLTNGYNIHLSNDYYEKKINYELNFALEKKYLDIARFLLENKATFEYRNIEKNDYTTIIYDLLHFDDLSIESLKLLHEYGADLNFNNLYYTPLTYILVKDDVNKYKDIIKFLMDHGATYNLLNNKKQTYIYKLIDEYSYKLIDLLDQEYFVDVVISKIDFSKKNEDTLGNTPLHLLCMNNDYVLLEKLLQYKENGKLDFDINTRNKQNESILYYAIQHPISRFNMYDLLLKYNCHIDIEKDSNLLIIAIRNNNIRFTKYLFKLGIKLEDDEYINPFFETIKNNSRQLFNILLPKIKDINQKNMGETLLTFALKYKNFKIVSSLLKHPLIDIDLPNSLGYTPLMLCSQENYTKTLIQLLKKGADVNLYNEDWTAINYACKHNNLEIVKLLKEYGSSKPKYSLIIKNTLPEIKTFIDEWKELLVKSHHVSELTRYSSGGGGGGGGDKSI
jgi:ankyrin repeat protein